MIYISIEFGIMFYTYKYSYKTFTEVVVVDGNLKSSMNETEDDNIEKLPLLG